MRTIDLAGGCFWGVEAYFKQLDGVVDTTSGYADGRLPNPTYEMVCNGSGHTEAVRITYDDSVISLDSLLKHYFNIINPTYVNRQGPDVGIQYRSGIYNFSAADEAVINARIRVVEDAYKRPIVVEVKPNVSFYEAEDYHQDYLDKNKNGYCHVNLASYKKVT